MSSNRRKRLPDQGESQGLVRRPKLAPPTKRCSKCLELESDAGYGRLISVDGFQHLTANECRFASQNGCDVCKLILDNVEDGWGNDEKLVLYQEADIPGSKLPGRDDWLFFHIQGTTESDFENTILSISVLNRDVSDRRVMRVAADQIQRCLDNHRQCSPHNPSVLPRRIIDVWVGPEDLKLVLPKKGTRGRYLALSYCWGGNQPVMLSKANQLQFQRELKFSALSKTIRDAITVTRKLGYRYLWVDSLCIVQDDAEDKRQDLGRMAEIYRGATATLAASVAKASSEGFIDIKRISGASLNIPFEISRKRGFMIPTPESAYTSHTPTHPLDERGWALQEYLLSERMLIFSDYELLWRCGEEELKSVIDSGVEYLQPHQDLPFGIFHMDPELGEGAFGSTDEEALYQWTTIVEQFTLRKLSVPDDRLGAIAGVAEALGELWKDTYRYGLWNKWIVQLLAWQLDKESRPTRRSKRAPSWSWICVDGEVKFRHVLDVEKATHVHSAECDQDLSKALDVLFLECSILPATDVTGLESPPECHFDLRADEAGNDRISYLYLGYHSNPTRTGIGLVVAEVFPDVYRRIGHMVWADVSLLDSGKVQRIALI